MVVIIYMSGSRVNPKTTKKIGGPPAANICNSYLFYFRNGRIKKYI